MAEAVRQSRQAMQAAMHAALDALAEALQRAHHGARDRQSERAHLAHITMAHDGVAETIPPGTPPRALLYLAEIAGQRHDASDVLACGHDPKDKPNLRTP
jgi:2'-5' RNA ligase